MSSKLGLHIIGNPPGAADTIRSANWGAVAADTMRSANWAAVKCVDDSAPLATAQSAGIPSRILRLWDIERMGSSAAARRWLQQDLSHVTHVQLCCESARGLDPVWQGEVIAGLRSGGYSGRFLAGCFATGNPTQVQEGVHAGPHFPELMPLVPLLQQPDVDLGLDEYTGLLNTDPRWAQWAPWTVQRHRLMLQCLAYHDWQGAVYILESGGDNVQPVTDGGGWQTRGWSAAQFLSLLQYLDQQDQQDEAVRCRCLFTLGATPDWASYEIAPIVGPLAAYVAAGGSCDVAGRKGPTVSGQTDYAGAVWAPSPNFWVGRQGQAITTIVLHGTAGGGAVQWFSESASQVSAHYVVDTDGTVTQCVREADSAWHAGVVTPDSPYAGRPNPNLWTIGIEHVRDQTNSSPLTPAQVRASLALCRDILARHPSITAFIPHDAIDVGRVCPGPDFPIAQWQALLSPATTTGTPAQPAMSPSEPGVPAEREAWDYYTQLGQQVDRQHAIWTVCLLPLYTYATQLKAQGNPVADLVMPGPLVSGEERDVWGGSRPAAVVRLTNRTVGVYQAADGSWRPYQKELAA